ncbi:hypothetical protein B0T17DRAFT_595402 [Bombardia bombarda]|uniref:Uncharacterized protein n=1 Tax=Bombardia bombarda TaxID=252184 RepID=A0AA40CFU4_9PEZI|nr:hypothetical protein B0T17DRAFT_595402 [Bombardia bombarda]
MVQSHTRDETGRQESRCDAHCPKRCVFSVSVPVASHLMNPQHSCDSYYGTGAFEAQPVLRWTGPLSEVCGEVCGGGNGGEQSPDKETGGKASVVAPSLFWLVTRILQTQVFLPSRATVHGANFPGKTTFGRFTVYFQQQEHTPARLQESDMVKAKFRPPQTRATWGSPTMSAPPVGRHLIVCLAEGVWFELRIWAANTMHADESSAADGLANRRHFSSSSSKVPIPGPWSSIALHSEPTPGPGPA